MKIFFNLNISHWIIVHPWSLSNKTSPWKVIWTLFYFIPIKKSFRNNSSGNFAEVKLALDKETGEKYAVKVIDKTKFSESPKFFEALRREVEIMMKIQHVCFSFLLNEKNDFLIS